MEPGGFPTDFAGRSMVHGRPLPVYEAALAATRAYLAGGDAQPGDPGRLAEVLVDVAGSPSPPLRLPLGSDSVAFLRPSLQGQLADLDAGEALARSTDRRPVEEAERTSVET